MRTDKALPFHGFSYKEQIRNPNIEIRNKSEILMFKCLKHINEVASGIASAKTMFWSFEFLSFEFVSNFVL